MKGVRASLAATADMDAEGGVSPADGAAGWSSSTAANVRSIAIVTAHAESLVNFRGHLLESLLAAKREVHYIGPPLDEATRRWLGERKVRTHEISISRNLLSPLADIVTFMQLRRALRRSAVDAAVFYMIKATIYGLLAAAAAGVRHRFAVITGLGYAFTEKPDDRRWRLVNRFARILYRLSLPLASGVVFLNRDDLRDFRRWKLLAPATPSIVVNGEGVDVARFQVARLPEEPKCLMIARLVTGKGVAEFIEAARIVKAAHRNVEFLILGAVETGPAAFPVDALRAAEASGLVTYLGTAADVRPFIASARIFVLPSFYREGVPRSIMEAMAMGRPIVTTDMPGCRETVVDGRNGLLVPPRDPQALAAGIAALVEDPEQAEAMGRESRRIAEDKYDVNKVTNAMLDFFWMTVRASGG
jgi:glycosyltransferase involved in cell wall biosynthesis